MMTKKEDAGAIMKQNEDVTEALRVIARHMAPALTLELIPAIRSAMDVYLDELRIMSAFAPKQRIYVSDLARLYGCSDRHIRRQASSGDLPPPASGPGERLWWAREDLAEFEAKRREEAFESGVFRAASQKALEDEYRQEMEKVGVQ